MRKNVGSQTIAFHMVSATDGSDVTSGTPTVYYTIDGLLQLTGTGANQHDGNGQWSYVPAQAETNGNHVAFTMVLAGAISQTVNVWPVSFDPTDTVRIGLTALPNAVVDAAGGLPISDAGGLDMDAMAADVVGLNGDAMRGTNNALLAASAPTNFGDLAITITTGLVSVETNSDKTGYSLAADQSSVTIGTVTTNTDMRGTDNAATAAALSTHDGKLDTVDANVDLILLDTGTDGVVISAATAIEIADAILKRDWNSVSDEAARSALNALRFLRNKWSIAGTTLTVTEEDDSTAAWTGTVSTDAAANPVTGNDPTGP